MATQAAGFRALGVCAELAEACAGLGWKSPTEIQEQAIPLALAGVWMPCTAAQRRAPNSLLPRLALPGRDVVGLAQTGSGKTGAFALPILQVRGHCVRTD